MSHINVTSLNDAIAAYKARPKADGVHLHFVRSTLPKFHLAPSNCNLRDNEVLRALGECAPVHYAWSKLFGDAATCSKAFKVIDAIIVCDAVAHVHQNLSQTKDKKNAVRSELQKAVAVLQEFVESEKSKWSNVDLDQEANSTAASLSVDLQNSANVLTFLQKYVKFHLDVEKPLEDYVLPKSQQGANIALNFGFLLCVETNSILGTQKYKFVETVARALYPSLRIGDLPHKFKTEMKNRSMLPAEYAERAVSMLRSLAKK